MLPRTGTSSLSFDFWSLTTAESKVSRAAKQSKSQHETPKKVGETNVLHSHDIERQNTEVRDHAPYRLPSASFRACSLAEPGEVQRGGAGTANEVVMLREKVDGDREITYPPESRRPRSWDGVVANRPEEWKPAGLGTLESLHNQTAVRIKWLRSASR